MNQGSSKTLPGETRGEEVERRQPHPAGPLRFHRWESLKTEEKKSQREVWPQLYPSSSPPLLPLSSLTIHSKA